MSKISDFLQAHERLILILAGLAVFTLLGYKWVGHLADVDNAREKQAQQVLDGQKAINEQQAAVVKQLEDTQVQIINQLNAQNQTLMAGIQARGQVTIVQQQKDKTLPLPDLSKRWESLAGLEPTDLTTTDAGVNVSDAGARLTVQKLEIIPELQGTIADGKQILDNKDKQIESDQNLITGMKDQVSGLNLQITAKDKQCDAQVTAVKATARKGKWKAFFTGIGVGVGVAAGVAIAVAVHI